MSTENMIILPSIIMIKETMKTTEEKKPSQQLAISYLLSEQRIRPQLNGSLEDSI